MRILHLDSGREMRGGQWQALRLHRGLVERGHESLLLAREGSPLLAAAQRAKLPCDVLLSVAAAKSSRGFDLVHAHDARSHTIGALFARAPLVVSRRVAFPVRDSALSRWKYRRAGLFLAVSRHVADAAEARRGGREPDRGGLRWRPGAGGNGAGAMRSSRRARSIRRKGWLWPKKPRGLAGVDDRDVGESGGGSAARAGSGLPHALGRTRLRYPAGNGLRGHGDCEQGGRDSGIDRGRRERNSGARMNRRRWRRR